MKTVVVKVLCSLVLLAVIVDFFLTPQMPGDYQPIFEIGLGLQYGVIAFTYVHILTSGGNILAGWAEWLNARYLRFHVKHYDRDEKWNDRYERGKWILKPVLTCDYCVGGQLALWLYFLSIHFAPIGYNYPGHLAAISTSILTAGVLGKLWLKIK